MLPFKTLRRDTNSWSLFTLLFVGFVTLPLFALFITTFSGPGESWGHLVKTILFRYTINSLALVLGTSFFATVLGVSSAWVVSRYQIPGKRVFEWLLILPLTIPSYITAYAYAGVFDYGGTFSKIMDGFGLISLKVDILNLPGLIFILSISLYPYVYVASRAVFLYQSGRLIEASKALGASEMQTFLRVVAPLARPAIFGGLLLVVMEVLNDYGAAKYFGVNTLTTGIFRSWFSLEEPNTAVFLSCILLVLVLFFVLLERWQRGNKAYHISTKADIELPCRPLKKKQRWFAFLIPFFPVLLGFVVPVAQLMQWLFLTFEKTVSSSYWTIAIQSVFIALLAALLTVLFVLLAIYLPKWNRLKCLKGSTQLATMGYAIPGAVLAIGVMIPTLKLDHWLIQLAQNLTGKSTGLLINGTIVGLVYAYIVRFLAVGFRPLQASQLKMGKALSDCSNVLGKGHLKTFWNIDLPLLRTGILSAVILVFVDIMKELPLTLILKPYHINTLAVKAYEYASDELIMESALPALTIIITGLVPIIFLNKLLLGNTTRKINKKQLN